MSAVMLAAIKIGEVVLGWSPEMTIILACGTTLIFSLLGGFRGVVLSDAFLFVISMVGSVVAAYYALVQPEIGSLSALFTHEAVSDKLSFIPDFSDKSLMIQLFIIPLAVQWWSSWYPGAEPGGGGYIAQRMLAAKDEKHAMGGTFLFNLAHYGLRPWPWMIVALCSLIIFPDLESIKDAFPNISEDKLGNDLGYSAMLTFIPHGLFGLVVASLLAAFMSTISTHLNWGSSYIVFDLYKRFINPEASEKQSVMIGRVGVFLLLVFSAIIALNLKNALQIFNYIIYFGAGTGLLFILRWFWWRINAWSEISAMIFSGIIAWVANDTEAFDFTGDWKLPFCVVLTTLVWIAVTLLTRPTDSQNLREFVDRCNPGGPGWKNFPSEKNTKWSVPEGILLMIVSCVFVYTFMFATGYFLYGDWTWFGVMSVICGLCGWLLYKKRENFNILSQ